MVCSDRQSILAVHRVLETHAAVAPQECAYDMGVQFMMKSDVSHDICATVAGSGQNANATHGNASTDMFDIDGVHGQLTCWMRRVVVPSGAMPSPPLHPAARADRCLKRTFVTIRAREVSNAL
jgi:hypothetical protein